MNTEKIDSESFQILFEESLVKVEKEERKDTVAPEKNLTDTDLTKKIEISLRPNRQAMDALIECLRKSCITYRLTPLIQLFLEKKDRFEIFITALQPDVLFCTQNENLPFLSKEGAFEYLIKKYWSDIFESEIIPLSPIHGHFISINRCGITDVLLGPPNYHLYNDLIKEHYNQHLAQNYTWEFFIRQIKNERDPLLIQQWQKRMAEHVVYRLKADPQVCFDNLHAAQSYLQKHPHLIQDNVKHYNALSLTYADVENIKDEFLKNQIFSKIKDENRSPVSLGCFCRTRFRHAGLHLYRKRKGTNHIAILCPIKRKIRNNNSELSEEWNRIVDYIEQHPMINIKACTSDFCSKTPHLEAPAVPRLRENLFKKDLLTLIKAGYIMQFEDGSLYVPVKPTSSPQKILKAVNA